VDIQYSGNRLLNVDQLSQVIGLAPGTIRNMLSDPTRAKQLPPRREITGIASVLFSSWDVDNWINGLPIVSGSNSRQSKHSSHASSSADNVVNLPAKQAKRRGRPTIRETIERQQALQLREFC